MSYDNETYKMDVNLKNFGGYSIIGILAMQGSVRCDCYRNVDFTGYQQTV
jgi:hypothetical protein